MDYKVMNFKLLIYGKLISFLLVHLVEKILVIRLVSRIFHIRYIKVYICRILSYFRISDLVLSKSCTL